MDGFEGTVRVVRQVADLPRSGQEPVEDHGAGRPLLVFRRVGAHRTSAEKAA